MWERAVAREADWEEETEGRPTARAIWADVGDIPINHPVFSGTTEMEGQDVCVCALANPVHWGDRAIVPLSSLSDP